VAGRDPDEARIGELLRRREELAEAREAIRRAEEGDESALPMVRRYLDEPGPEYLDVVDVARIAREAQIKRVFGPEDLVAREAMGRKLEGMRREILGEGATPLEGLLADRVVLCWLQLYYAEIKHAEMALRDAPDIDWTQDEYHQRRVDRLQRRYVAAIKGLAQVRRLLGGSPSVQINIADKQINKSG